MPELVPAFVRQLICVLCTAVTWDGRFDPACAVGLAVSCTVEGVAWVGRGRGFEEGYGGGGEGGSSCCVY